MKGGSSPIALPLVKESEDVRMTFYDGMGSHPPLLDEGCGKAHSEPDLDNVAMRLGSDLGERIHQGQFPSLHDLLPLDSELIGVVCRGTVLQVTGDLRSVAPRDTSLRDGSESC